MSLDISAIGGKIGSAVRDGRSDEAQQWRGELAIARIERAISKHLAAAPPLNDRQKALLRAVVEAQVNA